MPHNFDEVIERRGTDSGKWHYYGEGVLPMWVADMDFRSPEPVVRALHERVEHGVFGYGGDGPQLKATLCERMARLYGWRIEPADILLLPGLVSGLNLVARAIGEPGDGVLTLTPVYPPFLSAPRNQARRLDEAQLAVEQSGQHLRYVLDHDALAAAVQPSTRLFMLCNPHNPIGRAFTRTELLQMGDLALRHDLTICADEIHSDLLLGGTRHIPIAALDPELAQRTITLLAPSKTYNLPGLGCSLAIVQNAELRKRLQQAAAGIVPHVNILGMVAAQAAYSEAEDWLEELRRYLTANRDYLVCFVEKYLPQVCTTLPEATYLAWLDCRALRLPLTPQQFFLERAKVALTDGAAFGRGGEGFVRLNFGCPRPLLEQGLEQIATSLQTIA
jgi:cysteine-S-conjugate beta-lyase